MPASKHSFSVTWGGSLHAQKGQPGEEIPIRLVFSRGDALWHIPSIHRFPQGLVIDFCIEVEPARIKAFIDKWDLLHEADHPYTTAQRRQIEREHPLAFAFEPRLHLNDKIITTPSSSSWSWISPDCLGGVIPMPEGDHLALLDHYGLRKDRCWSIHRAAFPHEGLSDLTGLTLHLACCPTELLAGTIDTPKPGEILHFAHPLTGEAHDMNVLEVETHTLGPVRTDDPNLEYPNNFTAMTFTLSPNHARMDFRLQDADEGDAVRRKGGTMADRAGAAGMTGAAGASGATSIGIIGGATTPMLLKRLPKNAPYVHTACSAPRFDPKARVRWEMLFCEKLLKDMDIRLI